MQPGLYNHPAMTRKLFLFAVLVALDSLGQCSRGGETADSDRLAPAGLPAFLAVESRGGDQS